MTRARWVMVLAWPLATACAPEAGGGADASDGPRWKQGEGLRVGQPVTVVGVGVDSEPLFQVLDATLMGDSLIGVADGSNVIRLFDHGGRQVGEVGGSGDGPGEFRQLQAIAWIRDTLWGADGWNGRLVGFSRTGEMLEHATLTPLQTLDRTFIDGFFENADPFVRRLIVERPHGNARSTGLLTPDSVEWYRYDRAADTLVPLARLQRWTNWGVPWRDFIVDAYPMFGRTSQAAAGAGYAVFWSMEDEFEVRRRRLDGSDGMLLERPYEPVSVTDADVQAYVEFRLESARDQDVDEAAWRQFFADMPKEGHFPPIAELRVDATGATWARNYLPPDQRPTWSVFGFRGDWLGEITLPDSTTVLEVGRDYLLGLQHDSMGRESVVVLPLLGSRQ